MSLKIVFMGTPDFAVPSLHALFSAGYDIVGVITATDKLGGRGKNTLIESAVKKYALDKGLRILQPKNLKDPEFQSELASLGADLQVVVAFRMLPVAVWDMPPMGTMNLHGSLLPKYRGAAPINWAIINGESETGVSTFLLKHEIDTGDLLMQRSMVIHETDTAGTVHDRMMILGAEVVLESVRALEQGSITPTPQDDAEASPAPKIFTEMCQIDFSLPARKVYDFIRGLSPWPTAWTTLDGKKFKVYFAEFEEDSASSLKPYFVSTDGKSYLRIGCANGWVSLTDVQIEGKKRMGITDFLNGYRVEATSVSRT